MNEFDIWGEKLVNWLLKDEVTGNLWRFRVGGDCIGIWDESFPIKGWLGNWGAFTKLPIQAALLAYEIPN